MLVLVKAHTLLQHKLNEFKNLIWLAYTSIHTHNYRCFKILHFFFDELRVKFLKMYRKHRINSHFPSYCVYTIV